MRVMPSTLRCALPMRLKPDTKQVAHIGLGSGITRHALLASALSAQRCGLGQVIIIWHKFNL